MTGYLRGDPLIVYVELVPRVQEIKGLWVHEFVDKRLNISGANFSNIYRIETASQIVECQKNASEGILYVGDVKPESNLSFSKNSYHHITYSNLQLNKPSRLIYWYTIQPDVASTYNTETTLRFYDTVFPDMDYPTEITVKDPQPLFDVGATIDNKQVKKIAFVI